MPDSKDVGLVADGRVRRPAGHLWLCFVHAYQRKLDVSYMESGRVEIGQILFVSASYVIGLIASFWMIERIAGFWA